MASLAIQCAPPIPPICTVCGARMRLRTVEPNSEDRFRAVDIHTFECGICRGVSRVRVAKFTLIQGDAA